MVSGVLAWSWWSQRIRSGKTNHSGIQRRAADKDEYFAEFLPEYNNLDELKAHYQRGGLGDVKVKKFLNNVIQTELTPIRERRKLWEARKPEVYEILKQGTAEAKKVAEKTLYNVRNAMKINYFDN